MYLPNYDDFDDSDNDEEEDELNFQKLKKNFFKFIN